MLSKEMGDEFFGGKVVFGIMDGSYQRSQRFGGLKSEKSLYNTMANKKYPGAKVNTFI